jgi:hypothetical protein
MRAAAYLLAIAGVFPSFAKATEDEDLARQFALCTVVLNKASGQQVDKKSAESMQSASLLFALAAQKMTSQSFVEAALTNAIGALNAELKKREEQSPGAASGGLRELMDGCRALYGQNKTRIQALVRPAPSPTAAPSEVFARAADTARTSFCKSPALLSCLQVGAADCEARIGAAVDRCVKDPGAAAKSESEDFVTGYFQGCVLSAFLAGNPQAKESVACIQQTGKK